VATDEDAARSYEWPSDHDRRPYAKRRNAIMTAPRARDWHGMSLEQIQAELRAISGTPYRKNENPVRRRKLWRRLDYLIRLRDARQTSNNRACRGRQQRTLIALRHRFRSRTLPLSQKADALVRHSTDEAYPMHIALINDYRCRFTPR